MDRGGAQRLIENLVTAVLWIDDAERVIAINPAGEALLSLSARQACGMTLCECVPVAQGLARAVGRALKEAQAVTERQLELKVNGNPPMLVDVAITPVTRPDGSSEVIVEINDIDRRHRIMREEHMLAQNTITGAMIRGMAHEIKNPLGGIRGAAQLLERQLDNAEQREYTRIIIDEADRLSALVDRLAAPAAALRLEEVNVHEVLKVVRDLVAAETHGIGSIVSDYDPSLPPLRGDRDQLIQAFLNLLRNATQAIDNTGNVVIRTRIQRKFTIGTVFHKLVIRIDVIDDGRGVPEELAPSIFYPMVTGRVEGTGLGLPIAQSIVNRHGGVIEFTSEPERTVFTVWLPIANNE